MSIVSRYIPQWPGVVHYQALLRAGASQADVRGAVTNGAIHRVSRGWFALPSAHEHVVAAVRAGGSLTGPSAAKLRGLWVPPFQGLHISVARGANGAAVQSAVRSRKHCVHWRSTRRRSHEAVEPLTTLLLDCIACMTEEMALTVVDSALNKSRRKLIPELITQHTLLAAAEKLPDRYRRTIAKADPLSQSGLETLVRLRLRSRGIRVTTQRHHPGVGHVDLLVGDRLVIEVDGRETHDTDEGFAADRARDLILFRDDVRCLRLTYAQVMHDWPQVEPIILSKIQRRDHCWGRGMDPVQREWRRPPRGYT